MLQVKVWRDCLPGHSGWIIKRFWLWQSEAARSLRNLNRLTESPIEQVEFKDARFREKVEKFRDLFQITAQKNVL